MFTGQLGGLKIMIMTNGNNIYNHQEPVTANVPELIVLVNVSFFVGEIFRVHDFLWNTTHPKPSLFLTFVLIYAILSTIGYDNLVAFSNVKGSFTAEVCGHLIYTPRRYYASRACFGECILVSK